MRSLLAIFLIFLWTTYAGAATTPGILPEMPSNPSIKAMASAGPMLQNLGEGLDNQLKQLIQRKQELSKVVSKQWNRTSQGGPEGIVVYRSLETTEFIFLDIARLVFAEKGRLGEAMKQLQKSMEGTSKRAAASVSDFEKFMDYLKQVEALMAKHEKENAALDREREKMEEEVAKLEEARSQCHPKNSDHWAWTAAEIACGERLVRQINDVKARFEKMDMDLRQRQLREREKLDELGRKVGAL